VKGEASWLDRLIEGVLSIGVVLSGLLLLAGLARHDPALLRAGILLLMSTPVARVVVVTLALFGERDWAFGAISLWILLVLLSSLRVARFI
jgi:uncharacterized membrane protein